MSRRRKQPGYAQPFHDGFVHVCRAMCSTCIYRPGNLVHLDEGRRETITAAALKADTAVTTLGTEHPAVCKGFAEKYATFPIRLAHAMNKIKLIDPPAFP
jgi:hypothetical protein